MDRGADEAPNEAKNSIDNPENADVVSNDEDNRRKVHVKKHVQNQLQEANTQLSFKVNSMVGIFSVHCFLLCWHIHEKLS